MQDKPRRAVLFRTDRIGDMILTMPAMHALAKSCKDGKATIVASPRTAPLFNTQPWVREVFLWDHSRPVDPLMDFLGENQFDTAVAFFPHRKIAWACWYAKIPVRVGTGFRWHSVFYSPKVFHHRAANRKHEIEYNFDLVAPFGVGPLTDPAKLVLPILPPEAREAASDILASAKTGGPYVAVHPGSGGSALNASPEHYGRIARAIEDAGKRVVITGTSAERERGLVALRVAELPEHRLLIIDDLLTLGVVVHWASVMVGPSTGPLHLAAAFGTPTIGLYPPIKAQSPVRWKPRGPKGTVLVPDVPLCQRCLPFLCRKHNCMESITPLQVVDALKSLLSA